MTPLEQERISLRSGYAGDRTVGAGHATGLPQRLKHVDCLLRVYVTVVPEDGKANREVTKLLARAVGIAKSCLTLVRGHTARDKVFRVD